MAEAIGQRALRGARPLRATDRAAIDAEHRAMLAARLTDRDRWLIRMVHEHRVLTGPQICDLAFPSVRVANARLLLLFRWRVLDRFQPFLTSGSAPMHYVLDLGGAAVLAAERGQTLREFGFRHDRAMSIAHSLHLAHTVGVNAFFVAHIAVARHSAGARELTAWWSEHRCTKYFGDYVRPDGYGRWRERARQVEFFLEYDTGTEALGVLAAKLADYYRLAGATAITTPLLVALPTRARETSARVALAQALAGLEHPELVPTATATPTSGTNRTAARWAATTARWAPVTPGRAPTEARYALIDLPGATRRPLDEPRDNNGAQQAAFAAPLPTPPIPVDPDPGAPHTEDKFKDPHRKTQQSPATPQGEAEQSAPHRDPQSGEDWSSFEVLLD